MLPGRDVPEGLNADEYFKLSIQYLLIGWKKQMVQAAKRAMDGGMPFKGRLSETFSEEECKKLGMMLGLVESTIEFGEQANDVVVTAFEAMREAANFAEEILSEFQPLKDVKSEVQNAIVGFSDEASKFFGKAVEEVLFPLIGLPTRDVPQGLSAEEYLGVAAQYKTLGWTEQARDALLLANEIDPEEVGPRALRYLRTRIPRHPVPHLAVQRNIAGHGQMVRGDLETARKTFNELIEKYPDFEWPYGNLGAVYIRQGKFSNATAILNRALDINENYLNAWLHLARARGAMLEVREAQTCVERAIKLDPDDQGAQSLKTLIDFLSSL